MRKFVVGIIIGAVLMFSGQAVAETVSQMGKAVDSEKPLRLDGKTIGTAIIIKGKSYAPVKEVANSVGLIATYSNTGIDMTGMNGEDQLTYLKSERDRITKKISDKQKAITNLETVVIPREEKSKQHELGDDAKARTQAGIDKYKAGVEAYKTEIVSLQAQLDSINVQITELETQAPTPLQ